MSQSYVATYAGGATFGSELAMSIHSRLICRTNTYAVANAQ